MTETSVILFIALEYLLNFWESSVHTHVLRWLSLCCCLDASLFKPCIYTLASIYLIRLGTQICRLCRNTLIVRIHLAFELVVSAVLASFLVNRTSIFKVILVFVESKVDINGVIVLQIVLVYLALSLILIKQSCIYSFRTSVCLSGTDSRVCFEIQSCEVILLIPFVSCKRAIPFI